MKRKGWFLYFTILLLVPLSGLSGCKRKDIDNGFDIKQSFFYYEVNDMLRYFDVEDQLIYYCIDDWEGSDCTTRINVVNRDCEIIQEFILTSDMIDGFDVVGNEIYYSIVMYVDREPYICFMKYNIEDKSTKEITRIQNIQNLKKLSVVDQSLYYIGKNDDKIIDRQIQPMIAGMNHQYSGEVIGCIDLVSTSNEELPINVPVQFAPTVDGGLVISAYDSDLGYYFRVLDGIEGTLGDPIQHKYISFNPFGIINKDLEFVYCGMNSSWSSLSLGDIKNGSKNTEILQDTFTYNILVEDNYVYYLYMKDEKTVIESLKISDFIRENKTIHMASSLQSLATPFGCGYEIMREFPDEESFALSVLAKDKEYDLFILDSRQDFSMNLKKNSSFYPLNELKYVNEYLEACFPYVKESAMTEDGAIWMLPIDINIPTIIYDKGNCVELGLNFNSNMSVMEFERYVNKLIDQEEDGFVYDFFPYIVQTNFFADNLRGKTDLEDDVFRQGAEIIKKLHIASNKMDRDKSWQRISNMLNSGELDQLLFNQEYYFERQERMLLNGGLSVIPLPTMNEHTDYVATTIMLCVNPYSNNLKDTLKYINSLCKYLLENNDGMILEGKDRYPEELAELYDIYAQGDIQFTIPNEIFHQEFAKYVNDQISLDELISTVNRKIDTYLKE